MRRAVVFLVKQGFGLFDVKRLYLDEFRAYYEETIYNLEQIGELAEGSYNKVRGVDKSNEALSDLFAVASKKLKEKTSGN